MEALKSPLLRLKQHEYLPLNVHKITALLSASLASVSTRTVHDRHYTSVWRRRSWNQFWHFFPYISKTRSFWHMVHLNNFLAEIQRQIVLKFGNIPFSTFRDMVVQSSQFKLKLVLGAVKARTTQILIVTCSLFMTMYSYKNTKWLKNRCVRLSFVCSFQI